MSIKEFPCDLQHRYSRLHRQRIPAAVFFVMLYVRIQKALITVMEVRSITGSTLFLRTAEHSVHDWDRKFNRPVSPVTGKPYVPVVHLCEKITASK